MQYEWIIVGLITIICSCSNTTCTTTTTTTNNNNTQSASVTNVDNRDIKRLWAAALQAINDAELQRLSQRRPTTHLTAPAPPATAQRPNSKRMKWRTNSKQLDRRAEEAMAALEAAFQEAEPRSGTYPTTEEDNHNPTYIDVRDHEPQPSPWWF